MTLEVDPSRRAVIGDVDVVGVRRIDTALVRDLLVSRPGRRYSQDELLLSQQNLYKSDLFRYATVNIDSAAIPARRRHGAAAGAGEREPPPADPREPGLRHRGLLPRRRSRWTSRNFLGGNGRLLDLTSRVSKVGVGDPTDLGLAGRDLRLLASDSHRLSLLNYNLGATIRRPAFLNATTNLAVSACTPSGARSSGCTSGARPAPPSRSGGSSFAAGIPLSLAYNLSYGRTEATEVSFCASFNACTPDVVEPVAPEPGAGDPHRHRRRYRGSTTCIDPSRGSIKSLEVAVSSRFLGSAAFQQFTRVVADAAWYRPLGARRGAELARPRRRDLRTRRWTSPPSAATSSRRSTGSTPAVPTTCAASSATSWVPWSTSSPQGEVDERRRHRPRTINPDSGPGLRHRRQHARGRQRRAPGARLPCSARGFDWPRSWTPVAPGSGATGTPSSG